MDKKDEMILEAEKTLRNLRVAAMDAIDDHTELSATFVKYSAELALSKINRLKEKVR